ncbi:MAG: hypothetical protein IKA17_01795 [Clostridia bacterium]|nr:hypothetical protein [Clostridia bacterium]
MLLEIAGLVIDVKNKYKYFEMISRGFTTNGKTPDFTVEVPEDVLKKAISQNPEYSDDYIEALEIYRIICKKMLKYDAMLMHCAAISVDNEAYLFTAVSGTGKTTHISLWKKKFKEKCIVVNGDKPILRLIDGIFYACGTPWRGKENYGENIMVPIKAICILERGEKNSIKKIAPYDAISTVITQTLRTNDMDEMDKMLSLTDKLLEKVPFYRLKCNMNDDAADVSYNGMN